MSCDRDHRYKRATQAPTIANVRVRVGLCPTGDPAESSALAVGARMKSVTASARSVRVSCSATKSVGAVEGPRLRRPGAAPGRARMHRGDAGRALPPISRVGTAIAAHRGGAQVVAPDRTIGRGEVGAGGEVVAHELRRQRRIEPGILAANCGSRSRRGWLPSSRRPVGRRESPPGGRHARRRCRPAARAAISARRPRGDGRSAGRRGEEGRRFARPKRWKTRRAERIGAGRDPSRRSLQLPTLPVPDRRLP